MMAWVNLRAGNAYIWDDGEWEYETMNGEEFTIPSNPQCPHLGRVSP